MSEPIAGSFRPELKRRWWANTVDVARCAAETSDGRRFALGYRGNGRKRVYTVSTPGGEVLAFSRPRPASGWRSFFNDRTQFLDAASGHVILERSSLFSPAQVRFGEEEVRCRHRLRKWFRVVFGSEHFEFESRCFHLEVRFLVRTPELLLPALCCGYMDYVIQSEQSNSGG
ncbi:MAG: hypothetical protein EOM72_09595 [Opitutae bacterium]|nr:hypothetical protein [Opitutae bacterium]